MPPGAATNVCRCRGAAFAALLAACAGADEQRRAESLAPAQLDICRRVERAYRERSEDYPALRNAAVADPAVAAWLVRLFVVDVFRAREGKPLHEDRDLLRAAARLEDPVESRAVAEIVALGAAAVPVLVGDLVHHTQPQPRELGVELLVRVGAPAIPALVTVARDGRPQQRRAAARALGAIGVDADVLSVLRSMVDDGDYAVRADALRALRSGGPAARAVVVESLRTDADPFVRRVAAQSLARFPSATAANALIDYLERCKRETDVQGELTAQASLQEIAGTRGPRTPAAWRAFASGLSDAEGADRTPR